VTNEEKLDDLWNRYHRQLEEKKAMAWSLDNTRRQLIELLKLESDFESPSSYDEKCFHERDDSFEPFFLYDGKGGSFMVYTCKKCETNYKP